MHAPLPHITTHAGTLLGSKSMRTIFTIEVIIQSLKIPWNSKDFGFWNTPIPTSISPKISAQGPKFSCSSRHCSAPKSSIHRSVSGALRALRSRPRQSCRSSCSNSQRRPVSPLPASAQSLKPREASRSGDSAVVVLGGAVSSAGPATIASIATRRLERRCQNIQKATFSN